MSKSRLKTAEIHSCDGDDQATQQCLSTGLFVRSLALARLALHTSSDIWTMSESSRPILADEPPLSTEKRAELQQKLEHEAQIIARELGSLKGSVMKVGQMLSMYGEHFLPPQVNRILKTLQSNTPSLDWKTVEPFVKKELQSRYDELEIAPRAIAAASIGQVHSAVIKKTGETIALKVQYPGVDRAITSDMRALKAIIAFAPGLPRGHRLNELIGEIEEMLWREVDYRSEAECAEKFAQYLANDDRFLIPKVRREWSTSKVLAIQMICGHRIDSPELHGISQERRNALADSLLDLYLRELFEFGCVQTDPHIGNYRVRLEGETACDGHAVSRDCIVLLDFGAVRTFEPTFVKKYRALVEASLKKNKDGVVQAGLDLGFLISCDQKPVTDAFYDFCRLFVEPFDPDGASSEGRHYFDSQARYDWSRSCLPARIAAQMRNVIHARELRAPPREAVFLDRKSTGLYTLLSALGAKTNGRETLKRALRV